MRAGVYSTVGDFIARKHFLQYTFLHTRRVRHIREWDVLSGWNCKMYRCNFSRFESVTCWTIGYYSIRPVRLRSSRTATDLYNTILHINQETDRRTSNVSFRSSKIAIVCGSEGGACASNYRVACNVLDLRTIWYKLVLFWWDHIQQCLLKF